MGHGKIHHHKYLRTMADSKKPENTHLFVETSVGWYFVDSSDNTKLLKSDDYGVSQSTVETRTKKIIALYPDFVNGYIYFADSDWDNTTSYIWKLTISDDSITELENTATINIYDVFVHDGDVFYVYYGVADGDTRNVQIRPDADIFTDWDATATPHWNKLNEAVVDPNAGDGTYIHGDEEDEYGFGDIGNGTRDEFSFTNPEKNDNEYLSDFDVKLYAKYLNHTFTEKFSFKVLLDGTTVSGFGDTDQMAVAYAWYTLNSSSFSGLPTLSIQSGDDIKIYMFTYGSGEFDVAIDTLYIDLEFTEQDCTLYIKEVGGDTDSIEYDSWNYGDDVRISQTTLVGEDAYILLWTESDGTTIYFWDNSAGSFTKKTTTSTTTMEIPSSRNRQFMTYDDGDIISFVLYDSNDSKYYYHTYSINNETIINGGEYDVCLMMDRNCNSNNALPFNLEKGFLVTGYKTYQISKNKSPSQLYMMGDLNNADTPPTNVILAISDTYLITGGGKIYQYIDFMNG